MRALTRDDLLTEMRLILEACRVRDLETWLAGGWAIEAQIPKASRDHDDIDFAVALGHVEQFQEVLRDLRYAFPAHKQDRDGLRPHAEKQSLTVQAAALRFGDECVCISVPDMGGWWLQLERPWLPARQNGRLGDMCVRCMSAEALLISKLSVNLRRDHPKAEVYEKDICVLAEHLRLDREGLGRIRQRASAIEPAVCLPRCPRPNP